MKRLISITAVSMVLASSASAFVKDDISDPRPMAATGLTPFLTQMDEDLSAPDALLPANPVFGAITETHSG